MRVVDHREASAGELRRLGHATADRLAVLDWHEGPACLGCELCAKPSALPAMQRG
jgi:hypothetical protein